MNKFPTSVQDTTKKDLNDKIIPIIIMAMSVLFLTISLYSIRIFNTHGHSMEPTINDNSYVICLKTNKINTGDIIAFESRGEIKIKRVIATANDRIDINEKGEVILNNSILKEDYINSITPNQTEIQLPHTVSQNSVFVLGDNRENSLDSRHHNVGDIPFDAIICEVKLVI